MSYICHLEKAIPIPLRICYYSYRENVKLLLAGKWFQFIFSYRSVKTLVKIFSFLSVV